MKMVFRWARGLLTLALLMGTGCLEFEKETAVCIFPPGTQELRCLLVYQGLRPSSDKAGDIETAKRSLTALMEKERIFYLFHVLLPVDLVVEEMDEGDTRAVKDLLRRHIKVHKGAFFLDEKGKLCAYQTLVVQDRDHLVAGLNARFSATFNQWATEELSKPAVKEARKGESETLDPDSLRLIQKASNEPYAWLRIEPGRVAFTLPVTPTGARILKRNILRGNEELSELLSDNPWSIEHRKDHLTVALGFGEGEPIRVQAALGRNKPVGKAEADLIAHARTLKVPFKKGLSAEGLIGEFLRSGVPERMP